MRSEEKVHIKLTDEMLINLLRGSAVNLSFIGINSTFHIRIEQEKSLVVIDKEDFRDLKIFSREPIILDKIFERIDK